MAKRLTKLTLKASILAGAIYATADQGLWKDTENADEAYSNLYKNVCPYFKELPLENIPKLPPTDCIAKATREYYNKGVMASVRFIQELPGHLSEWTVYGTTYLYDTITSASSSVSGAQEETEKKEKL